MYDYLDSVINLSWMYMHDKKVTYYDKHVSSRKWFFVVYCSAELIADAKAIIEEGE